MEHLISFLYDHSEIIIQYIRHFIKSEGKKISKSFTNKVSDDFEFNKNIFTFKLNNNKQSDEYVQKFCKWFKLCVMSLLVKYAVDKLEAKTEFANQNIKTEYIINVAKDKTTQKLFVLCVLVYYMMAKITKNRRYYLSIDYEFTQRQNKLAQLCYETPKFKSSVNRSYIWVICPGELEENMKVIFLKYSMECSKIKKLTNGSDSLDVPYMFEHLFQQNKRIIKNFSKSVIDLRFYCEYFKVIRSNDKKCSIYDLLQYFKTITKEKYDELEQINHYMGPTADRVWDIHNLSSYHLKYAYYDVLFLKNCLLDIYKQTKELPYHKSFFYLPQITGFIFLEKWAISNCIITAKQEVDPLNNFIIKHNNENIFLVLIYNKYMQGLILPEINMNMDAIMGVNYFKTNLTVLFKKIVYSVLLENYKILKKKNEFYNEKLSLENLFSDLKKLGFNKLIKLFLLFHKHTRMILSNLYK